MQPDRSITPLAVMAALLLLVSVGVLVNQSGTGIDASDISGAVDGTDVVPTSGTATEGADGDSTTPDASATDGSADPSDDGTQPAGDGATDGAGSDPDGTASDAPDDAVVGANGLSRPASGTYTYASKGTWGLSTDVMNTLPATAQAVVTHGTDSWALMLTAGDRYGDSTQYSSTEAGIDWIAWTIDRTFSTGPSSTRYICESETPFHVADNEKGREASHVCQAGGGQITSTGSMVTQKATTVTLGDGSTVDATHIIYDSVDTGEGVSGGGRIELWLQPETGLRLKETRALDSRQEVDGTVYVYTENVSFTLQSLTPSA